MNRVGAIAVAVILNLSILTNNNFICKIKESLSSCSSLITSSEEESRYIIINNIRYRTRKVIGYEDGTPIFIASCVMIDEETAYTATHVVDEWIRSRQESYDPNDLYQQSVIDLEIEGAGKVVEATVINGDLAIIKFEKDQNFSLSSPEIIKREELKIGMPIILSGYSGLFGLSSSETTAMGTIAEVDVPVDPTAIIVAAAGGPGCSGGGVWTLDGRLIGVVSSGGMGFVVISTIDQ